MNNDKIKFLKVLKWIANHFSDLRGGKEFIKQYDCMGFLIMERYPPKAFQLTLRNGCDLESPSISTVEISTPDQHEYWSYAPNVTAGLLEIINRLFFQKRRGERINESDMEVFEYFMQEFAKIAAQMDQLSDPVVGRSGYPMFSLEIDYYMGWEDRPGRWDGHKVKFNIYGKMGHHQCSFEDEDTTDVFWALLNTISQAKEHFKIQPLMNQ